MRYYLRKWVDDFVSKSCGICEDVSKTVHRVDECEGKAKERVRSEEHVFLFS